MTERQQPGPGADAPGPGPTTDPMSVDAQVRRSLAIAQALAALQQLIGAAQQMLETFTPEDSARLGTPLLQGCQGMSDTLQTIAGEMLPAGVLDQARTAAAGRG